MEENALDLIEINGRKWSVRITDYVETPSIMDTENAGRVIKKGAMTLDRIGTFMSHKITFDKKNDEISEFDSLYEFLIQPRNNGINVNMIHNQHRIKYKAYCTVDSRKLKRYDKAGGVVYWGSFTANFIPMEAQITP